MYNKCHTQHKYIEYYVWWWMTESNCECCRCLIPLALFLPPSHLHFIRCVIVTNCKLLALSYMSQSYHWSLQFIISLIKGMSMHQQRCNLCRCYYISLHAICSKTGHIICLLISNFMMENHRIIICTRCMQHVINSAFV